MEIEKILVAFDGSKHSEKGLDIAISLVKESKRSIVGLFVKPHSVESLRYGDIFSNIKKMPKEKKKQIQNDSKNFLIQISKT